MKHCTPLPRLSPLRWPVALAGIFVAILAGEGTAAAQPTFTVTKNVYDGPEWWGTITIRNNGPVATSNFTVEFDVPAGVHCTAEPESVPPGATLSPLTGSGSSARTVSNHCVFTWSNTTLLPGASKTFNYSTDSQNFSSASNVRAKDHGTGATCSTFAITKNVYDGPEWWGTISFKNWGPYTSYNYKVEFDIPAGYNCTNDYVPPGATLSPLVGTGSSARTVSNHCVYSWSNASPLYSGQTKTFNYSTNNNKTSFKSASNLQASDRSTCVGAPACLAENSFCSDDSSPSCCAGLTCSGGKCVEPVCKAPGEPCDINVPTECCTLTCLCPVGNPGCTCG